MSECPGGLGFAVWLGETAEILVGIVPCCPLTSSFVITVHTLSLLPDRTRCTPESQGWLRCRSVGTEPRQLRAPRAARQPWPNDAGARPRRPTRALPRSQSKRRHLANARPRLALEPPTSSTPSAMGGSRSRPREFSICISSHCRWWGDEKRPLEGFRFVSKAACSVYHLSNDLYL